MMEILLLLVLCMPIAMTSFILVMQKFMNGMVNPGFRGDKPSMEPAIMSIQVMSLYRMTEKPWQSDHSINQWKCKTTILLILRVERDCIPGM